MAAGGRGGGGNCGFSLSLPYHYVPGVGSKGMRSKVRGTRICTVIALGSRFWIAIRSVVYPSRLKKEN